MKRTGVSRPLFPQFGKYKFLDIRSDGCGLNRGGGKTNLERKESMPEEAAPGVETKKKTPRKLANDEEVDQWLVVGVEGFSQDI